MAETIAERVRKRREELGLNQSELARDCGEKPQSIQKLEAGTVRRPRYLVDLARVLEVTPDWLLHGVGRPEKPNNSKGVNGGVDSTQAKGLPSTDAGDVSSLLRSLPRDVPVMGTVQAGPSGAFELNRGEPIDFLRRPPALAGAADLYALYVIDDSMAPKFEHGEPVFVHPGRPAGPGDYVVVQQRNKDGDAPLAFIKRLKRRTAKWLVLEQLNPRAEMKIAAGTVVSVHKVLTMNELWGV